MSRRHFVGTAERIAHWVGLYGPAWRFRAAQAIGSGGPFDLKLERETARQATYWRLRQRHPQKAAREYPLNHAAMEIERQEQLRQRAQLLSLAGVPANEIDERLGMPPGQIQAWQNIFFDLQTAEATDWLQCHVILPTMEVNPLLAVKMRLARYGGRVVLDDIFAAEAKYSDDEVTQLSWIRNRFLLQMEAALDFSDLVRDGAAKVFEIAVRNALKIQRLLTAPIRHAPKKVRQSPRSPESRKRKKSQPGQTTDDTGTDARSDPAADLNQQGTIGAAQSAKASTAAQPPLDQAGMSSIEPASRRWRRAQRRSA
jgi:hypothetical protein